MSISPSASRSAAQLVDRLGATEGPVGQVVEFAAQIIQVDPVLPLFRGHVRGLRWRPRSRPAPAPGPPAAASVHDQPPGPAGQEPRPPGQPAAPTAHSAGPRGQQMAPAPARPGRVARPADPPSRRPARRRARCCSPPPGTSPRPRSPLVAAGRSHGRARVKSCGGSPELGVVSYGWCWMTPDNRWLCDWPVGRNLRRMGGQQACRTVCPFPSQVRHVPSRWH